MLIFLFEWFQNDSLCVCACVLIIVYPHARIAFNIFFRVLDKNDCFRISLSFIVLHSKTTYSTSTEFVLRTFWHKSFCVDPGWSTTRTVCISRIKRTTEWATWTAGSKTPTTGWQTTSQRSRRLWRTCTRTWPSRYSTVRWSRSPWPGAASKWAPPSCQVRHTRADRRIVVFISRKKKCVCISKTLHWAGQRDGSGNKKKKTKKNIKNKTSNNDSIHIL